MDQKIWDLYREINYGVEDRFDGKGYRYYHCLRTARLALEIAENDAQAQGVDRRAMVLLALFHDIGKNEKMIAENDLLPEEHDANNVVLCEKYLYPLLLDRELASSLRRIVPDFSLDRYECPESRAVRDADNLDEIGILNLWRMGVYAGKHHADVRESTDFYLSHDRRNKIDKMRGLFFAYSRQVFDQRLAEMDDLVRRLQSAAVMESGDLETDDL